MGSLCLQERLAADKRERRLGIHSFHRFFGKLIPAIPAAAIELYTEPGDLVLDPFCGSGTTLVEAVVRGRNAVGMDINPLAVLISRVKTTPADPVTLRSAAAAVLERARTLVDNGLPPPPYCVNIHHWYRPKVIRQLSALHTGVNAVPDRVERDFLRACLSAVNRNVSNADPHHVFPGYSKRLRLLDVEKGRRIDVFSSFQSGVLKRLGYLEELLECWEGEGKAVVLRGSADSRPPVWRPADLIVTNPPYISSVRYLETLKLEMSWAGFIDASENYRDLDKKQIGTERFTVAEKREYLRSGVPQADEVAGRLFAAGQGQMSRCVALYFKRMKAALKAWDAVLRSGGRILLKLSPSRVRGEVVPTPEILKGILEQKGYQVEGEFHDAYNPASRSLLTARNYYSGRMDSDTILLMRKP